MREDEAPSFCVLKIVPLLFARHRYRGYCDRLDAFFLVTPEIVVVDESATLRRLGREVGDVTPEE